MKRRKNTPGSGKVDTSAGEGLKSSPFAGLGQLRDRLPAQAKDARARSEQAMPPLPTTERPPAPQRAVVRYQRRGRGGKEVTLVERLDLPPTELDEWLGEIKRSLGCGGARESETLVLQGDQRERLRAWLEVKGVGKVSVS